MSKWVSQKTKSSISNRGRKRTEYLKPLQKRIESDIKEYFESNPLGQQVTLFVLKRLGKYEIEKLENEKRKFDRIKQDIGLFVAMNLVDIYSPERIQTYRDNDGVKVSTRNASWDGLEWVNRYTPHRLIDSHEGLRIVLDTSVIRQFIHNDPGAINIKVLGRFKKNHPISIAETAWVELIRALVEGRESKISFDSWMEKIHLLDQILDPLYPVVPVGKDAAPLNNLFEEELSIMKYRGYYYKAVWDFTKKANSHLFSHSHTYQGNGGQLKQIGPLDIGKLQLMFKETTQEWKAFIERILLGTKLESKGKEDTINHFCELVRLNLKTTMSSKAIDQLDLLIKVLATYAYRCNKKEGPYVAKETSNDAFDFNLLTCTVLPAIVCTNDNRLINLCEEAQSADSWKVMSSNELIGKLIDNRPFI